MKYYLQKIVLFLVLLTANIAQGQNIVNRISASLENLGNGQFNVRFTPLESLSGIGNPIIIYLKIPQSQSSGSNIEVASTNFSIGRIDVFPFEDFQYFYFQGQPAVNLGSWQVGIPVTIATFQASGPVSDIILSGGDFGLDALETSDGFFWPGTSIATDNTATNLIGWPIAAAIALPVELTFFTAEPLNDKTALLKWQTATEINNDFFQIEHSINGVDFRAVGKERGAGTTDLVQDYSFIHRKPVNGSNYYRLKQVDLDGAFEYSPVEVVYFDGDRSEITNFKIFPNPSDSYLMILPPGTKKTPWNVNIFDIQGKLMNQFIIRDDQYRLDTADWPTGIYHIQIQGDNRTEQYRFVKD